MTDNLFPFMWMAIGLTSKNFYSKGGDLQLTGGSPRYNIYKTQDDGYLALGALEEKFWLRFCKIINLPSTFVNDKKNPSCKILSPISEEDKEWRYGIFRYNPGKQETIENGVKSWAGK